MADIQGAQPQAFKFQTKRCCDPLMPRYNLPSFISSTPEPAKFIKCPLNTGDIDGAQCYRSPVKINVRNTLDCSDIEGARPKKRYQSEMKAYDCYRDVTHPEQRVRQPINPLEPVYTVRDSVLEQGTSLNPT